MSDIAKYLEQLESAQPATRRAAAKALGKKGAVERIPALIGRLTDSDMQVRLLAIRALKKIGHSEVALALVPLLTDPKRKVQIEAANALGRLQHHAAIAPLCDLLTDERVTVRDAAWNALQRFGDDAIVHLCKLLASAKPLPGFEAEFGILALLRGRRHPQNVILRLPNLNGGERWHGLEALRKRGYGFLNPLRDIHRYCTKVAQEDATLRAGAQAVLDYLTLIRPTTRDYAAERSVLLRASSGAPSDSRPETLLRPSSEDALAPVESPTPPPTLWERVRRWLSG